MSDGRFKPGETAPAVAAGLARLSERAEQNALDAGVEQKLIELVKMRASQINGCAYCLNKHSRDAVDIGEKAERLAVLSAWRETHWFSPEEEAALELTESVTLIADGPLSDEAFDRVSSALGEDKYAAVFWVATVINSYNRLAISSHHHVGPAA